MQFKHPEILYALLLLIIPIIVHLFQLQRFVKVPFTNVKFLKNIVQQTRKSSKLKKWLILLTRMLAFTCLIIAFSQPYFSKYNTQQNFNINLYLDNSFSMQAKGENGELLKSTAQKIIENLDNQNRSISLLTNNNYFKNLDNKNLKNNLINLQYYPNSKNLNTVLLQFNSEKSNKINTSNKNILITDFQFIEINNKPVFTNVNSSTSLLKLTPKKENNIFIDSVFINNNTIEEITINVLIKSIKNNDLSIPISLFDNETLIGKTTVKFDNSNTKTVQFNIANTTNFNGKISLIDPVLKFDNDFYFTISKPEKINVLSIGKTNPFLTKIYTKNEFNFNSISLQNLNYNNIQNQELIVLNELDNIPNELASILTEFSKNGGSIVIIPSQNISIETYNQFFNFLQIGRIDEKLENEYKVTSINYEHPLLNNVFEKRVTNFQYPTSSIYYKADLLNSNSILKIANNESFISSVQKKNSSVYWIGSPLNKEITNFTQSSLIVPIFYNFAKNSLQTSQLYYTIKPINEIEIKTTIGKDDVLNISNNTIDFIPLQTISQNRVSIHLKDNIFESGFYNISNKSDTLKTIAFNYNRQESVLTYLDVESLTKGKKNVSISSSIDEIFNEINDEQKINWLFKWFLAFSVLFLFIEMLILKYFNI